MSTLSNDPPENSRQVPAADVVMGDRLWTGGRMEPVVTDPYTTAGIVHLPTSRDGEARTRTFAPDELVTIVRPDLDHPAWCDPNLCQVGEGAGLLADHHLSAPRVLAAPAFGDVIVSLQLSAFGSEPLDTVSVDLEVTLTRTDGISVEGYAFNAGQVHDLLSTLAELAPAMTERPVRRRDDLDDGHPAWCTRSHPGGSPVHAGRNVEVELARGVGIDLRPVRRPGWPAVVELAESTVDDTRLMDVTPAAARAYGLALLAAAAQAEGGA